MTSSTSPALVDGRAELGGGGNPARRTVARPAGSPSARRRVPHERDGTALSDVTELPATRRSRGGLWAPFSRPTTTTTAMRGRALNMEGGNYGFRGPGNKTWPGFRYAIGTRSCRGGAAAVSHRCGRAVRAAGRARCCRRSSAASCSTRTPAAFAMYPLGISVRAASRSETPNSGDDAGRPVDARWHGRLGLHRRPGTTRVGGHLMGPDGSTGASPPRARRQQRPCRRSALRRRGLTAPQPRRMDRGSFSRIRRSRRRRERGALLQAAWKSTDPIVRAARLDDRRPGDTDRPRFRKAHRSGASACQPPRRAIERCNMLAFSAVSRDVAAGPP